MLPYEKPTVAADGSTTIEIYYDRYYYLMSFDLGGGYGTEPVYARYEASISVDAPLKSGYTFDGWEYNGHDADIPATMPAENQEYTALWAPQVGESSFTVVYWLQNPDPDKDADGNVIKDSNDMPVYGYSYWASYIEENYTAGQKVNGENYKTIPLEQANQLDPYEKQYSFYSYADGETTVSGDNSTVVNVYYNRNTYTLKFYYAFSSNSGTSEKYYVVGGSSNYFGTLATQSARNDEIKLLDQYNGDSSVATTQRGNVDELPTLNSVGLQRSYTLAADASLVNNTNVKN